PDHVADIYEMSIPSFCIVGRFDEATELAIVHEGVVEELSPHHRVHGVAVSLEVAEVCGEWERIAKLADRTTATVDANLSTPCIRNARSLLVTALAAAYAGDARAAESFEQHANDVATEGYDIVLAAPRAQLALGRGEIDVALRLVPLFKEFASVGQTWF